MIEIRFFFTSAFSETCVRERARNSCKQVLGCGHVCAGFKDELVCPPCLHGCDTNVSQRATDNCIICYTDELAAAPVIMVSITKGTWRLYNVPLTLLTLKAPRKTASENVVCLRRLLNILADFSNLFLHTGKQCGP